jgi:hypothetical protein
VKTFHVPIRSSLIAPGRWRWLPVPSEAWFISGFLTIFFYRVGCQPHAQPPTWSTRPLYSYPLEAEWPSYTPRHQVPILVAAYDTHGPRWGYSYFAATTRELRTSRFH